MSREADNLNRAPVSSSGVFSRRSATDDAAVQPSDLGVFFLPLGRFNDIGFAIECLFDLYLKRIVL